MATSKKSFVLYSDLIHTIEKLPDEKAGELFKLILYYVNDKEPVVEDLLLSVCFEPIKQQLKRDLTKWSESAPNRKEKARKAGIASAKARQLKATKSNSVVEIELKPTKSTATVNATVNAIVNAIVNETKEAAPVFFKNEELNDCFSRWIRMCHEKGKNYAPSSIEALQMKMNCKSDSINISEVNQSLEKSWVTLRPVELDSEKSKQKSTTKDVNSLWER